MHNGGWRGLSTFSFDEEASVAMNEEKEGETKYKRNEEDVMKSARYEDIFVPEEREDSQFKIMDEPQNMQNWELWIDLMKVQEQTYGIQGIASVFLKIQEEGLDIPTEGRAADALWSKVLSAGLDGGLDLMMVVEYAKGLEKRSGKHWDKLYVTIVTAGLRSNVALALDWHQVLKDIFELQPAAYGELLHSCIEYESLEVFSQIYGGCNSSLYGTIIPILCKRGLFDTAFDWHFKLLSASDLPVLLEDIESLLLHYARRDEEMFGKLTTSVLTSKAIKIQRPLQKFLQSQRRISKEVADRQLRLAAQSTYKAPLSDTFCARLFATRFFRVDSVIIGLQTMGLESLGPLSVREIVVRNDCDITAIFRHFDRLRDAGIALGLSDYIILIRRAMIANKRWLLQSIMDFDAHPETYKDYGLQEKIFTKYLAVNDVVGMERTLAILTLHNANDSFESRRINIILRASMRLRQRAKMTSLLAQMNAASIPLEPASSRTMRVTLLNKRRTGKVDVIDETLQNIDLHVNVMRKTLEGGRCVPITSWKEILRRLGMAGRLAECKSLVLWLAEFYMKHPELGMDRTMSSWGAREDGESISEPTYDLSLPNGDVWMGTKSLNPIYQLEQLFTTSAQHAFIAWGFQQEAKQQYSWLVMHDSAEEPIYTWGLVLLRQLRDRGVKVSDKVVSHYCEQRLRTLFNDNFVSHRYVNRSSQRFLKQEQMKTGTPKIRSFAIYFQAMEKAWGQKPFSLPPALQIRLDRLRLDQPDR
ncbi:uncharacterized protein KY384_002976 [Bacidia gigantensis]|uniref:uncharacterized protein n=1 Tax=Bacidia gigantensis TaxID=2732470 RepID=UPI001D055A10|nr:uncharacterized protein KY384_002976 [Bacidia gigantensis]KAG8531347.1 hypothetical protein KY384_002976 [Bacidia gigantensis]